MGAHMERGDLRVRRRCLRDVEEVVEVVDVMEVGEVVVLVEVVEVVVLVSSGIFGVGGALDGSPVLGGGGDLVRECP